MALLSRKDILKAQDLPTKDVEVPEWGGTVRVRSLTARDRDAIETALIDARQKDDGQPVNIRARYAAACIVDENGSPLFSVDDVEVLGGKSGGAVDRVYEAISALNLIDPAEVETQAGESSAAPI